MQMPALEDTILAVSSGGESAAVGIVRLSGPESFQLVGRFGLLPPAEMREHWPWWTTGRISLEKGVVLPATVFWFRRPRSYTSQNLVEIHTVGCLPLLRLLTAELITRGARQALPGEFTARAFLAGKLDARQVGGVLALLHAADGAAAQQAARRAGASWHPFMEDLLNQIADLLALVEAGIDFVEEEDVSFITPAQACERLDRMQARIAAFPMIEGRDLLGGKPHVALAGLPNAGKSTLFNALLGRERAIVSPLRGTTRDVLTAEIEMAGVALVLQDSAGLGETVDELEQAAHCASERAADQADLVLWVHDSAAGWDAREIQACRRIPAERRVLLWSKIDQFSEMPPAPVMDFSETVSLSAATGTGLAVLRNLLARRLGQAGLGETSRFSAQDLQAAMAALTRARKAADSASPVLNAPEIVALELRAAYESLQKSNATPVTEEVLGRIFSKFCVGK